MYLICKVHTISAVVKRATFIIMGQLSNKTFSHSWMIRSSPVYLKGCLRFECGMYTATTILLYLQQVIRTTECAVQLYGQERCSLIGSDGNFTIHVRVCVCECACVCVCVCVCVFVCACVCAEDAGEKSVGVNNFTWMKRFAPWTADSKDQKRTTDAVQTTNEVLLIHTY